MKKIYLFFIGIFITLLLACSSNKVINYNEKLTNCINSEKFKKFYAVCRKEVDTVIVYSNFDEFANCQLLKYDCNKTIKVIKSDIKINNNASNPNKIVLYKYEIIKNKYILFFINTETNGFLNFILNKKNEVIDIESGAY